MGSETDDEIRRRVTDLLEKEYKPSHQIHLTGSLGFSGEWSSTRMSRFVSGIARIVRGRRRGTGYITSPDDFRERVFPVIRLAACNIGHRVTEEHVCEHITNKWPEYGGVRATQSNVCRPRQLRRWFTSFGWQDWDAVVSEALEDR